MSFKKFLTYSIILLFTTILLFLFSRKIYRNKVRKILFPKKVFKEELEKNKKYNELYQKNKLKELIRRQEILHKKQKDVQVYKEASKIIDIVKPVGKWTKMIIIGSDLIQHFTQLINKNGKQKGFWELFIKTQVLTRGKHKGKGR